MGRSSPTTQARDTKGLEYKFRSGKYEGKTVQEVVEGDPNYILWLFRNTNIDFDESVIEAAEEESRRWNP